MNYFVQEIAGNYLKNVVDKPQTMKIHPGFLYGIDKDQFQEGFLALLQLVRNLCATGYGSFREESSPVAHQAAMEAGFAGARAD